MPDLTAPEARTLLARAFAADPLMVWFFPDDEVRPHACAAMFGLFAEHYLEAGRVDCVHRGRPVAVAMWQWPGQAERDGDRLPTLGGLMSALMGAERAAAIGGAMAVLGEERPSRPHAYLHLLGVDPDRRGEGLGGELLDRGVAAARAAGLVACLDTMNPENVPFYEAHGLSVRHELVLPDGGPTVWSMTTG
ncbi:GNAT family N-acetyltransferase [Blastococcus litoris]|uniref:GNAT family N-acetyltransferase n=1 Tax=Blastococcus litoris TaxID=2171622 RepID=UPI000E306DF3|nr:GNAT family N-acetyltransferase [Blastococcus litoris]